MKYSYLKWCQKWINNTWFELTAYLRNWNCGKIIGVTCLKYWPTIALKALHLTLGSLSLVKLPRMLCNICVCCDWPGWGPKTWSGDPRQPIISKLLQRTKWLESLRFWNSYANVMFSLNWSVLEQHSID